MPTPPSHSIHLLVAAHATCTTRRPTQFTTTHQQNQQKNALTWHAHWCCHQALTKSWSTAQHGICCFALNTTSTATCMVQYGLTSHSTHYRSFRRILRVKWPWTVSQHWMAMVSHHVRANPTRLSSLKGKEKYAASYYVCLLCITCGE